MRIREGSQVKTGMAEEKETKGIDYQTWEFTGREYLEIAGISLGIAAAVNLLCYRAWWACIAVVPVGIVCFHTYRKNRIQRRKEELYDSFRDLIAWMHTALRSGYSMENAVLEAAGQLEQSLGKENILVQELRRMRHKMMISVPVGQLMHFCPVKSSMRMARPTSAGFTYISRSPSSMLLHEAAAIAIAAVATPRNKFFIFMMRMIRSYSCKILSCPCLRAHSGRRHPSSYILHVSCRSPPADGVRQQ